MRRVVYGISFLCLVSFLYPGMLSAAASVQEYVVTTLAGLAGSSLSMDGIGNGARFKMPLQLAVDRAGNIWVLDGSSLEGAIRKISPTGVVVTMAKAADPEFFYGIANDIHGNVYLSTTHFIERIEPDGHRSRLPTGDAPLTGLFAVDPSSNLYVYGRPGGTGNGVISKITPAGSVSIYSSLTSPAFPFGFVPAHMVVDSHEAIFALNNDLDAIYRITPGEITLLAGSEVSFGSEDGTGENARFWYPRCLAIDKEGVLYVADTNNYLIRRIDLVPFGLGFLPQKVSTIAGKVRQGGAEDGIGSAARFRYPRGIAVDAQGDIYVADTDNYTIRRLALPESQNERAYFAQFANGDGITSEMVLSNPSATNVASGKIEFFDNSGMPHEMGAPGSGSWVAFTLGPLSTFAVSSDGQGPLIAGAARVSSNVTLAGFIRFSIPGLGISGVGESQPLTGFVAPVRGRMGGNYEAGGIYTGLAIHNIEEAPITINLSLRDQAGRQVPNGSVTIIDFPALGHLAKFLYEIFPAAPTADFEGSVVVQVIGGRVAATVLELGTMPGQFTTLPVAPLK